MSHFTVLVIGENPEEQLAPYQEGSEAPEYRVFNDIEDEHREKYETETVSRVILADGIAVGFVWDEKYNIREGGIFGERKRVLPRGAVEKEVPVKEIYPTFEQYMEDYSGYDKDETHGRYEYYHNPNSKWDWYSLGGRWTGFLKLKPQVFEATSERDGEVIMEGSNRRSKVGRPGIMTEPAKSGYADSALLKDIDFEGMIEEAGQKAQDRFETIERLLGGSIPKLKFRWKEIIDDNNAVFSRMTIDEKRDFYHNQDAKKAVLNARNKPGLSKDDDSALTWLDLEDFQMSKEEFVKRARDTAINTFAVLKDGKWYERGEMGWWAVVHNEKEGDSWNQEFADLIKGLDGDTLISVYDCHI